MNFKELREISLRNVDMGATYLWYLPDKKTWKWECCDKVYGLAYADIDRIRKTQHD